MLRRALLLAACLAAAPGTAHALSPPAGPDPPDRQALRAAGLGVHWPVEQLWRGGQTVTVRVTPLRRRHRSATLSLVRVRRDGRDGRTLARRTLRAGRFAATLPRALGRRYALRLRVGRRVWSTPITVRDDASGCPSTGVSAAELRVVPAAGRVGDHVTVTVRNTGDACLSGGWDYGWERRLPDGSWRRVEGSYPIAAIAVVTLPGRTSSHGAFVWPELQPGPHRLIKVLDGPDGARLAPATPFEVLP